MERVGVKERIFYNKVNIKYVIDSVSKSEFVEYDTYYEFVRQYCWSEIKICYCIKIDKKLFKNDISFKNQCKHFGMIFKNGVYRFEFRAPHSKIYKDEHGNEFLSYNGMVPGIKFTFAFCGKILEQIPPLKEESKKKKAKKKEKKLRDKFVHI